MKLSEILDKSNVTLSFETFPPKAEDAFGQVWDATKEIARLSPDFMSVTYGAGGGTSKYTTKIVAELQDKYQVPALAHLTCTDATKESIQKQLQTFQDKGIENILALRGDILEGSTDTSHWTFPHANNLIDEIKSFGDFCVGGACYPETHPEAKNSTEDIDNIKRKVESGCDFLTTQMFFDNNILYNYLYRLRDVDINVPVIAGIMPVTNANQIKRIQKLSGAFLPRRFVALLDRFGDNPAAMKQAGIAYATDQIIDLIANGVNNIHIYTMNKPDIAGQIQHNISDIIYTEVAS